VSRGSSCERSVILHCSCFDFNVVLVVVAYRQTGKSSGLTREGWGDCAGRQESTRMRADGGDFWLQQQESWLMVNLYTGGKRVEGEVKVI
jgi:hypothetical protein